MRDWSRSCAVGIAMAVGWCLAEWLTTSLTAGLACALVVLLAARMSRLGHAHRRLRDTLNAATSPAGIGQQGVRVGQVPHPAMVAGLLRPTIYLQSSLLTQLDPDALRAVVAHESAHARRRDPLRLLMLATLEPMLRVVPGGPSILATRRSHLEILADQGAVRSGASRSALARALLTISPSAPSTAVAAFASDDQARLRSLLEETPLDGGSVRLHWAVQSLLTLGLAVLTSAAMHGPAGAALREALGC